MRHPLQSHASSKLDGISGKAICQGEGQRQGGWGGRNDRIVSERVKQGGVDLDWL